MTVKSRNELHKVSNPKQEARIKRFIDFLKKSMFFIHRTTSLIVPRGRLIFNRFVSDQLTAVRTKKDYNFFLSNPF
jgi:hypothetical protein